MKSKLIYFAFALAIIAASAAYARRGPSSVFTFAVHPLSAYANQIGGTNPPPGASAELENVEQDELNLFN